MVDGRNLEISLVYNSNNDIMQIVYEIGEEIYEYDDVGNFIVIMNFNGYMKCMIYDVLNWLIQIMDVCDFSMFYGYDVVFNVMMEVSVEGDIVNYIYDVYS